MRAAGVIRGAWRTCLARRQAAVARREGEIAQAWAQCRWCEAEEDAVFRNQQSALAERRALEARKKRARRVIEACREDQASTQPYPNHLLPLTPYTNPLPLP